MADLKISELTNLTAADPANDMIPIVDVSATPPASGSTKRISINNILACSPSATLASATISGALTVDTTTLVVNPAGYPDRVGIGTATPARPLDIVGSFQSSLGWVLTGTPAGLGAATRYIGGASTTDSWYFNALTGGNHLWAFGESLAMTLNSTGLGVGVVPSAGKGALQLSSGINFPATQVASSDANTLDDYEEGTWTIGLTFGGGSTGITTNVNTGRYTKIGRQVTVTGRLQLTSKGSSTGSAFITGLPFTIASGDQSYSAASFRVSAVTYTGAFQSLAIINTTTFNLEQVSTAGVVSALTDANFANNSDIVFSLTYTV